MLVALQSARATYTRRMNLVETLGVEIGVRQAGTPAAGRAADAVADAFRDAGLEIDGERWDAGPCIYSNPTDGTVEGRVRRLGTHSIGGFFPEADVFAVEDERGRELARLLMSPFGGAAIPFLTGARQIAVGPALFISGADSIRLREMDGARAC